MFSCSCIAASAELQAHAENNPIPEPTALVAHVTGDPDTPILSASRQNLVYLNDSILLVKYLDANGQPSSIAAASDGRLLADHGEGLRRADIDRRFELFGALDEELWDLMLVTPPEVRIPVGSWLRSYQTPVRREDLIADPDLSRFHEYEHETSIAQSAALLQKEWSAISRWPLRIETSVPVAFGEMSHDELVALADHPSIARIYWDKTPIPQWTTYTTTVKSDLSGFTGLGERVCVIEGHEPMTPNTVTTDGRFCPGIGIFDSHSRQVIGVVRSGSVPNGTAPNATFDLADFGLCGFSNANPGIAWCASRGATVWNWSHTCSTLDNRVFDFHAKNWPFPVIVAASGNQSPNVASDCATNCPNGRQPVTCSPFNALVVGGTNDCGTIARSDDKMFCATRDQNIDARELPHGVAPAFNITVEGSTVSGTSFAAPMVTGVVAQLHERSSPLVLWPEAARSIVMAGADEDIHGVRLNLLDGTDDRDGAGQINAQTSVNIARHNLGPGAAPAQVGWFGGTLTAGGSPPNTWYGPFRSLHSTTNGRLRFVLSGDSTAICTNPSLDTGSCASDTIDADLDLYVFRDSDGTMIA